MEDFKYKLQKYNGLSTRFTCPNCEVKRCFTFYVDNDNEPLNSKVGRCERVDKCGYNFTPAMYFKDQGVTPTKTRFITQLPKIKNISSFIDNETFENSLKQYNNNNLFIYLSNTFGIDKANEVAIKYKLGTSKYFKGGCIFWQIDENSKVHTGKIMGYDSIIGKRVKQPFNQITWAHTALKLQNFELNQCLFGLHLIKDNNKPIAIVESEKTAMIASLYLPQFIWLATSGKTQFTQNKAESLKGRKVVLFPDLGGFEDWQKIAKEYSFSCSDLLERKSTTKEKEQGFDLADYLITINVKLAAVIEPSKKENIECQTVNKFVKCNKIKPWDIPNFTGLSLPPNLRLDSGTLITNVSKCINSHLKSVNANIGNKAYFPYLDRLNTIYKQLSIL